MKRKKGSKQQAVPAKQSKAVTVVNPGKWKYAIALAIIVLISFIVYLPALQNGFVWDDEFYIQKNQLIQSINLQEIFSRQVIGNYHPLTMLMLAIEYHFFGLNEAGYHMVNLLLHLLNVILVFYVVFLLSDKYEVALIASLLFGIHPIHVESVAWVSELKDLLYAFFFLASYIFYLRYLKDTKRYWYVFALLFFLFSLLSKAMAVSLPVVLVLTDFIKGRKFNAKLILEKAPFFLLALLFGVVAIFAQKSVGATDIYPYTFPLRVIFSCYGFMTYLFTLVWPLNLSAYYPYPVKLISDLPVHYYGYVVLLAGLIAYVIYSVRFTKKIFLGLGFFAVTVFLVLQLLPVGGAVMADRYSYIPSMGIFYLAGEGWYWLWDKKGKVIAIVLLGALTIFFSSLTYSRCSIWKSEMTLWSDVISKYQTIAIAYNNRGNAFMAEVKYDEALIDLNKAIELNPYYSQARNNRGILFDMKGNSQEALTDFNAAIEFKPDFVEAYTNRGLLLVKIGKYEEARSDFDKAILLKPNYVEAYFNRGNLLMNAKEYSLAFEDFTKAIELKPDYIEAYINRGIALQNTEKYDEAFAEFSKVIQLQPDFHLAYFNRGYLLFKQKKYEEAILDFSRALERKADAADAYYFRGLAEFYAGKKDLACRDLNQAGSLGYQSAADAIRQICN